MTDRATIFQTVQWGVETISGGSAAANRSLQALGIEFGADVTTQTFRPMGNKFPALVIPDKEQSKGTLTGALTYSEVIYPLSSVLTAVSGSALAGTAAYQWQFTPSSTSEDSPKTFTIEQGSTVRAHRVSFAVINALTFDFSRNAINIGGDVFGGKITDNITMTAGATAVELVPVLPEQIDVYFSTSGSGLSSACALNRVMNVNFGISNRYNPLFPLQSASAATGYAGIVEVEPKLEMKIKMEADAEGMALLPTLRAGDTIFIRVQAIGATIASSYKYTFTLDMAGKVSAVSPFADQDGVFAIEWTFTGVHDATWGKALQITVINKQTAL